MPQPGDPSPRLPTEDAFLELLTDTLETLERPPRGQFLQRFFKSIAHVDLTETQSLDIWDQTLARKRELSEVIGQRITLQTALIDVLSSGNLLRLPIVIEYEELRNLQINAATDPLTGLYNRRFFDDYFEKELNRSNRYSHRLALVVFDLHRFKEVNDRYGHQRGDLVLQMAATTLRNSLRTSDYAFRIGGDEFALLLPQSDPEQAVALSRRLRAAYAAAIEPLHMDVKLALDFGLAVYPDDGDQKEILIRVSDERLYLLKNGAKNGRLAPNTSSAPPVQPPASTPEQTEAPRPAKPAVTTPPAQPAAREADSTSRAERRRWERVSLSGTRAYALIGEGVECTARVVDLGYGGVALETPRPDEIRDSFDAVLHVPILPPVRVSLKRIYQVQGSVGNLRVGCSFVT